MSLLTETSYGTDSVKFKITRVLFLTVTAVNDWATPIPICCFLFGKLLLVSLKSKAIRAEKAEISSKVIDFPEDI